MSNKPTVVLSVGQLASSESQNFDQALRESLTDRAGSDLLVVPHLYDLTPDGPAVERLRSLASDDLIVLARLYPRAAFWMLDANGVQGTMGRSPLLPDEELEGDPSDTSDRTIWCFDLREHTAKNELLGEIERIVAHSDSELADTSQPPTEIQESGSPRWYPVIDYNRCQNCMECLNFCLFGVFGVDEQGRLFTEQPDACRNGCPACSRVCPSHAIMFPRHTDQGIAGDPTISLQPSGLNLVQLLGSASPADMAAAERDKALQEPTAAAASQPDQAARDELDDLVDELDQMDL